MQFEYKVIQVKKSNGEFVFLRPVAITRLIEFSWQVQSILNILEQLNVNLETAFLVEELQDLKTLTKNIFYLSNLSIDDFSHNLNEVFDLLITLNKLNQKQQIEQAKINDSQGISLYEYISRMVTMLVHLELALDLKEAFEIADSFPADQLESLINARILQVDPEYEKKAKEETDKKELMENLISDLQTGIEKTNTKRFIIH